MRTALIHYWMTNFRGGEAVLAELSGMLPGADIFTHAFAPEAMQGRFDGHRITESFIARLPFGRRCCRKYLPLMPCALRRFDLSGYDLIVSSESGPAKGIIKPRGATHICYCHTPMRYLYDMYDHYYRNAGFGGKLSMKLFAPGLRRSDAAGSSNVDHFIANSAFVAGRIERIYGRSSTVIHPPVNVDFFAAAQAKKSDYYLFAGELASYKRPDLAIAACRRLGRRLLIAGGGDRKILGEVSGDTVFLGRKNDAELREIYAGAKALLFPGVEDFGIVPVEAQAAGTPVIAFRSGGALETVRDGVTGVFFDEPTPQSLAAALEDFESRSFDPKALADNAKRFSAARFRREMTDFIKKTGFDLS